MARKPAGKPTMMILFLLAAFFVVLMELNVITLAFVKMGIPHRYVSAALFALLFGSLVNIPVKTIRMNDAEKNGRSAPAELGTGGPMPKFTVVAINIGGAVFPTLISIYLLVHTGLYLDGLIGIVFMTAICYRLAKPIEGVGIAVPFFMPPVLAALLSVLLAGSHAPVIAYASGTLGMLIGGDLLNLTKIARLKAPVVSIGGAGTFDGIFLVGIVAVLLSVFVLD